MVSREQRAFEGNAALKLVEPRQLRLVYNRRATTNGQATPVEQPKHIATKRPTTAPVKSSYLVLASIALVLAMSTVSLVVDTTRRAGMHSRLYDATETTIHVTAGDTLWSIAERCGGGEVVATSDVVAWIRNRNNLDTSALSVGQSLTVPKHIR